MVLPTTPKLEPALKTLQTTVKTSQYALPANSPH